MYDWIKENAETDATCLVFCGLIVLIWTHWQAMTITKITLTATLAYLVVGWIGARWWRR